MLPGNSFLNAEQRHKSIENNLNFKLFFLKVKNDKNSIEKQILNYLDIVSELDPPDTKSVNSFIQKISSFQLKLKNSDSSLGQEIFAYQLRHCLIEQYLKTENENILKLLNKVSTENKFEQNKEVEHSSSKHFLLRCLETSKYHLLDRAYLAQLFSYSEFSDFLICLNDKDKYKQLTSQSVLDLNYDRVRNTLLDYLPFISLDYSLFITQRVNIDMKEYLRALDLKTLVRELIKNNNFKTFNYLYKHQIVKFSTYSAALYTDAFTLLIKKNIENNSSLSNKGNKTSKIDNMLSIFISIPTSSALAIEHHLHFLEHAMMMGISLELLIERLIKKETALSPQGQKAMIELYSSLYTKIELGQSLQTINQSNIGKSQKIINKV